MTVHLVLDCADPRKIAEFWAEALGFTISGFAEQWGKLEGPSGEVLLLQQVPEPKVGKNRMHIDIHVPEIEAKAVELERLGATRVEAEPRSQFSMTWITMADPEGNEFCVCKE